MLLKLTRWVALPLVSVFLFLLWLKPWAYYREPLSWPEFQTEWLEQEQYQTKPLLVFVNSAYGVCAYDVYREFDADPRVIELVELGKLNIGKIDFAYVTPPPPGRSDEYDWLYDQDTYKKECFFILIIPNQKTEYFTMIIPTETLLERLGNPPFRSEIYFILAIASSVLSALGLKPFIRHPTA